ncbi:alpha/beta hydrolase [Nonomuraea sp. KC401]|uniref:alpha/beta fold hydrolase n=1 Tax=unclassified Nonomuraea TaxID=2593643 RepID=UPI0010FF5C80|nr:MULTISPECIES: alpha/beta hydrolase [unclassified Nonomuraea]NBE95128.1 hypothetical protein [Nonomuraea sp. K271]TLF73389.1 alpha/beta hydrolase [Nonomuraea sp. KC401]
MTSFNAAMRDRAEDKLPHVAVPTLVVGGELDGLVPQDWPRRPTRGKPLARLVVMPMKPHMIPFRAPEALASDITKFAAVAQLRRLLRRGHRKAPGAPTNPAGTGISPCSAIFPAVTWTTT